jgi:hypothetical protein
VELRSKGDALAAGIKDNAPVEPPAGDLGQGAESFEIVRREAGRGLDFDPNQPPGSVFQDHINLGSGVDAEMEQPRPGPAPADLFVQLHDHEVLEQRSQDVPVLIETALVQPQQVGDQTGVRQVELRGLDQPLADIDRPGRRGLYQEGGLQQIPIAFERGLRNRRVPGEIGEVAIGWMKINYLMDEIQPLDG